jgi:hypothetical protein
MPAVSPETSRAAVKILEEGPAAFWNHPFPAAWRLVGPDDAVTVPSSGRRTKVA